MNRLSRAKEPDCGSDWNGRRYTKQDHLDGIWQQPKPSKSAGLDSAGAIPFVSPGLLLDGSSLCRDSFGLSLGGQPVDTGQFGWAKLPELSFLRSNNNRASAMWAQLRLAVNATVARSAIRPIIEGERDKDSERSEQEAEHESLCDSVLACANDRAKHPANTPRDEYKGEYDGVHFGCSREMCGEYTP